jgi:hypothetical protein
MTNQIALLKCSWIRSSFPRHRYSGGGLGRGLSQDCHRISAEQNQIQMLKTRNIFSPILRFSNLIRNSNFEIRIFLVLFLASFARADTFLLTDVQFHTSPCAINSIDSSGIHTPDTDATIPWDDILELSHSTPPATYPPGKFTLLFHGGDRLTGDPVSFDGNSLQWKNPALGPIAFPIDSLLAISHASSTPNASSTADFDQPRTDDVVRLSNGDSVHGIVNQIAPTGVTIQTNDATPTLPWDTIDAVLFSSSSSNAASAQRRMFRLHFPAGESITVPDISLSGDKLTLTFSDKSTRNLDLSQIAGIEQLNGPIAWLTSLKPTENIYKPFFSENFPTVFDRTVSDHTPISEKYPAFHHGIGCHSYSKLTYALAPQWSTFRTQFAIDSNSPLADVTVRIYLDDKPAFEEKNVKAGRINAVVTLPLDQAKALSLEVDYGENYATEDRFVWLDPALIRKLTEATTQPTAATTQP